jgi:hypothetical protein
MKKEAKIKLIHLATWRQHDNLYIQNSHVPKDSSVIFRSENHVCRVEWIDKEPTTNCTMVTLRNSSTFINKIY